MHHLGRSKVTKLSAKAGVVYPLIRLPKSYADQIGKVAEIFETQPPEVNFEAEREKLYAKIGQLEMERDWLKKISKRAGL